MRRGSSWIAAGLLALGACVFDGAGATEDGSDATDGAGDPDAGPGGPDAGPGEPDATPPPAACPADDPALVACYDFESPAAPLFDASGQGHDGTAFGVLSGPGPAGHGLAARFIGTATATVPDDPRFDLVSLTLDVWVRLDALPAAGQRFGVVDKNGQYGIFIGDTGAPRCTAVATVTGKPLELGQWSHVGCTLGDGRLVLFQDGDALDAANVAGAPPTGADVLGVGQDSPSGDGLVGALDTLRLWSRALSPDEVCAAAGKLVCLPLP